MPQTGLWHFRVHYDSYTPKEIIDFIKARADIALSVLENDATRSHIHSVITEFKQTKSTFVQQFLKEFPKLSGNGCYSCSKKDDYEAQLRYCLKGESKETEPIILVCREGIDWKDYHKKYWEENALLKAKSKEVNMDCQNGSSLNTKVKSKTWTEKVYDEIKQLYTVEIITIQTYQLLIKPTAFEQQTEIQSRMIIFRYMMKCFGKAAKKISTRILQEIFDGFINGILQDHDTAGEKYADKMFKQIYY